MPRAVEAVLELVSEDRHGAGVVLGEEVGGVDAAAGRGSHRAAVDAAVHDQRVGRGAAHGVDLVGGGLDPFHGDALGLASACGEREGWDEDVEAHARTIADAAPRRPMSDIQHTKETR